jgi:hypothetical protein
MAVNSTQVYLWCSDIEPAWTEVWMNSTRHLVPADAPLAHDGVGVVVSPGAHVSHHTGTLWGERAAVIIPTYINPNTYGIFPSKSPRACSSKAISYFYFFQQFFGIFRRCKISE